MSSNLSTGYCIFIFCLLYFFFTHYKNVYTKSPAPSNRSTKVR